MQRIIVSTIALCLVIVSGSISASGQKTITGQVTAFNKYTLKNVEVESKKSKQLVKTDSLGIYSIDVSDKDKIQFKADGFYSIVFKTDEEDTLNVNLIYIDNKKSFDDVIKNNVLTEAELSEALEKYMDENNNFYTFQNIFDLIQSVHPSVFIDDTSSPTKLYLPGKGTVNNESGHEALLVVNKIMTFDISDISPVQVKKVKVLTGNDASLFYGSKGSNGVIEIELKE